MGRFLSPDPYVQAPNYTQSYNRYSYVWNNPMKYTDPPGYQVRQQDAHNWTNPWDVFIHGSGPWVPFKAEGSGPFTNPVTQGGRFMPSMQVGPTYEQHMNLRFWSNVTSTLMMNGSGYVITSINAFGKTNFVGSFGPLGNMSVWDNGGITFDNKTAAMHLFSAWVFADDSSQGGGPGWEAYAGAAASVGSEMFYSKTYGTWMGKNFKMYKQTWGGNRIYRWKEQVWKIYIQLY